MTKNEITQKLLASGQFHKTQYSKDYKFPLDKDIILVPIRTQEQLDLCGKLGLEFFEREIADPRGFVHQFLVVATDFETIAKAIAYKKD